MLSYHHLLFSFHMSTTLKHVCNIYITVVR